MLWTAAYSQASCDRVHKCYSFLYDACCLQIPTHQRHHLGCCNKDHAKCDSSHKPNLQIAPKTPFCMSKYCVTQQKAVYDGSESRSRNGQSKDRRESYVRQRQMRRRILVCHVRAICQCGETHVPETRLSTIHDWIAETNCCSQHCLQKTRLHRRCLGTAEAVSKHVLTESYKYRMRITVEARCRSVFGLCICFTRTHRRH